MNRFLERIYAMNNLFKAWKKVRRNNGIAGSDHVTVQEFEADLKTQLLRLQDELRYRKYQPVALLPYNIPKSSGEQRRLYIPAVRDRVAQQAFLQVIEPLIDRRFEQCSYAYRRGRSRLDAIQQINQWHKEGYSWVLNADIEAFFDNIDHSLLLDQLSHLISEPEVIDLATQWIQASIKSDHHRGILTQGVPQGCPVSPLFSNLYMNPFDKAMTEHGHRIIRYADDILVVCENRRAAEQARREVDQLLYSLRLSLNLDKTTICRFDDGFEYLGAFFYQDQIIDRSQSGLSESKIKADVGANIRASHAADSQIDSPISQSMQRRPPVVSQPVTHTTLYIQQQGSVLAYSRERLQLRHAGKILFDIPTAKVREIIVLGNCHLTTPSMKACLKAGIPISFLSQYGNYQGRLESSNYAAVELHRLQFSQAAKSEFCLATAQGIVMGKINNSRVFLQRRQRKIASKAVRRAIDALFQLSNRTSRAQTLDELRGYEGAAAAEYFGVFSELLIEDWGFEKRIRRPPTDPVNALLGFGYTLLFQNTFSLILTRGLHPYCGYLHAVDPGHPTLASDLIEEFRVPVVDSLLVYLLNARILKADHFEYHAASTGRICWLSQAGRSVFLEHFERKMTTRIRHPHTGQEADYRRCIGLQMEELIQALRGAVPRYRPMVIPA